MFYDVTSNLYVSTVPVHTIEALWYFIGDIRIVIKCRQRRRVKNVRSILYTVATGHMWEHDITRDALFGITVEFQWCKSIHNYELFYDSTV